MIRLEQGGPKAVGIIPTTKKEQELRQDMLNTKFAEDDESFTINKEYVCVNVTSYGGNTTIHPAIKVLKALGKQQSKDMPYEVVVVLGSGEERDVNKIYKNRYHIAKELVSEINNLVECVNAAAETQISKRNDQQIQKHIKFAVFCNLTSEKNSANTRPFGYEWPIREMDLETLRCEAESHGYKKAA